MAIFSPPLADYQFCLNELFDWRAHAALPGFADFAPDVVAAVLEQAARFTTDVIFPLGPVGDAHGCSLSQGAVTTAPGFREAYGQLCDGGWPSLTCAPEDGGQGLPHMVNALFEEMLCGASMSFALFPGLTRGAYVALRHFGNDAQRALYLPRLASGEWTGAMCLTEAQAGTDLGLLKAQAVPQADGSYAITGTKIFISAGEHDLTPNIIYLALARLPGAPAGTKGISLFVVPKFLSDAEGKLGARNAVLCSSLERKMGIHACPTCVMNFDGATGWLVGKPQEGLKAMFAMMNAERIAVGIQGLGVAQASYANAVAYARERLQGRSPDGARQSGGVADPIIVHPDVRRMLMTMRVLVEGGRMLALETARQLDISEHHDDAALRAKAAARLALLTPVTKAFLTDIGSEVANLGVQVYGGHGYIRDHGQEQYVRDARIAQIYEGTNGVQAMDFLGRKVLADGGAALADVLAEIDVQVAAQGEAAAPLAGAVKHLREAAAYLLRVCPAKPFETGAAAVDFLRLFALVQVGSLWLRAIAVSEGKDDAFHTAKRTTAAFFLQRILPQSLALHATILSGASAMMDLDAGAF